jgi:hypothetical protein
MPALPGSLSYPRAALFIHSERRDRHEGSQMILARRFYLNFFSCVGNISRAQVSPPGREFRVLKKLETWD